MSVISVPVTKGKAAIEVELDQLPEDVYREMCIQGMKVLLNRGMSKITKETYPDEEELKAAANAKAAENLEACKEGKIRFTGSAKTKGISGVVKTEAMRLARGIVKDEIKKAGGKISHYSASDITAAAKELLEASPELIEQAKANLAEREKTPVKINISAIPVDPKRVKAAEEKAAKAKAAKAGQLSAKQAGMPAKRKKGQQAEAGTAH